MAKVERFPASVATALAQGQIDGVLHFSRRSAQAYIDCAGRAGLLGRALDPLHFCLSRQVAEPLVAQDLVTRDLAGQAAARIRIAAHPDEAAMIALVSS
jgi:uroporphyrinogen-III synthase